MKIYKYKNEIPVDNVFRYILFDSNNNQFICLESWESLDLLIEEGYKNLHAVLLDKPIRPFADIDINVPDLNDILTHLKINDEKAEHIKNHIITRMEDGLMMLETPEENLNYLVATDHRKDKYSYAVYFLYCSFKNLATLKKFWKSIREDIDDDLKKFFDTPSSNFRLVGCYKDDHVRRWEHETEYSNIDDCIPNSINSFKNFELSLDEEQHIEPADDYTDEDMRKMSEIAKDNEYLNESFVEDRQINNSLTFRRVSASYCDLCEREHDSIGAYTILMGICVYRGCFKCDKKKLIGKVPMTIPEDMIKALIEEPEKPVPKLPPPTNETKKALKYCNDASYLLGSNWKAEDVNAWIKSCIFKVNINDIPKWITLDYDNLSNREVMEVQDDPPYWDKSNRKKIQIDGKPINLSDYIINFCNMPGNYYTNLDNYPYLHEKDNKYKNNNNVINMWSGFNYPYTELKHNDIKDSFRHWVSHFKFICNGDDTFIKWLAHGIQRPFEKAFNVQMLGKKGTGKSIIFECISRIYGPRSVLQVSELSRITGDFNALLENKLIVNLNECTNFAKKKEQNIFKSLTTETGIQINQKHKAIYKTSFYGRFLITTNEKFGIEITPDDRRNYCVETPDQHRNDKKYFAPLVQDITSADDTPFRELFNYLANYDISDFSPMNPPSTKLKQQLIKSSINPMFHYLLELVEGERNDSAPVIEEGEDFIVNHKLLYDDYKRYMTEQGEPAQLTKRKKQFDDILEELGLSIKKLRLKDRTRIRGYRFNKLSFKENIDCYIYK